MSDLISDFGYNDNPRFNQSAPLNYSVEDIYNITRGAFNEFDMKGYNPPKTAVPISHEYKIPGDKDRDIFASITKRAKEPDPATYAEDKDKVYKRYWDKATGKFKKGRRNTFTEETMKISAKIPGPGAYMPTPRAGEAKKVTRLGKFKYFLHSKSSVEPFLCNFEALAEEVPGANAYFLKAEDREKAFAKKEKKTPSFRYYSAKPQKVEKSNVGPGYLKDLEASYEKSALRRKTPDPSFAKAKNVSFFHQRAQSNKFVPGVGTYKDSERAYTSNIILHKERVPYISKYKYTRFTEAVSKAKEWVPGPGSYEVVPYAKKKKTS